MTDNTYELAKNLIAQAQSILVVVPQNVKREQVSVALALAGAIRQTGKSIHCVSPENVQDRVDLRDIPELESLTTEAGNKDLDITFEYDESAVDKVSYHIDENDRKFHLVVQPKRGAAPLDPRSVQFHYTGTSADLVISIGVDATENLGDLAKELENILDSANIISIHSYEPQFGSVKLSSSGMTGISELAANLVGQWGYQVSADIASQLLIGLDSATRSFQSPATTAETFELIARLLRAGGTRPQPQVNTSNTARPSNVRGFAAALGGQRQALSIPTIESNDQVPHEVQEIEEVQEAPKTVTPVKKKSVLKPDLPPISHGEGSGGRG